MISGRVISTEKEVVDFATVYLKGTNYGSYTDEKGIYHLKTVEGEYILGRFGCRLSNSRKEG